MKRAFKFDQRLFYSGKRRILWLQQAKAVIETHPNVFDLKSMFTTIITRLWNYTPRGQMSGLIKKINVFSSLSLEQKWRSLTVVIHSYDQSRNCPFDPESVRGRKENVAIAYAGRNERWCRCLRTSAAQGRLHLESSISHPRAFRVCEENNRAVGRSMACP